MSGHELKLQRDNWGNTFAMMESVEDIGAFSLVTSARVGNEYQIQDANASAAAKRPCWGITVERVNNSTGKVVLWGFIYNANWTWTPRAALYLGNTDGLISESPGAVTQEVGWALTATTILFSPKCVE